MNRSYRLTSSTDIKRVRRTGTSYAHPLVLLIAARNELERTRLGVVAGKRLGGAVARNRAKRRLRAAFRELLPSMRPGWDLICVARPGLLTADWQSLLAALAGLVKRAELWDAGHIDPNTGGGGP